MPGQETTPPEAAEAFDKDRGVDEDIRADDLRDLETVRRVASDAPMDRMLTGQTQANTDGGIHVSGSSIGLIVKGSHATDSRSLLVAETAGVPVSHMGSTIDASDPNGQHRDSGDTLMQDGSLSGASRVVKPQLSSSAVNDARAPCQKAVKAFDEDSMLDTTQRTLEEKVDIALAMLHSLVDQQRFIVTILEQQGQKRTLGSPSGSGEPNAGLPGTRYPTTSSLSHSDPPLHSGSAGRGAATSEADRMPPLHPSAASSTPWNSPITGTPARRPISMIGRPGTLETSGENPIFGLGRSLARNPSPPVPMQHSTEQAGGAPRDPFSDISLGARARSSIMFADQPGPGLVATSSIRKNGDDSVNKNVTGRLTAAPASWGLSPGDDDFKEIMDFCCVDEDEKAKTLLSDSTERVLVDLIFVMGASIDVFLVLISFFDSGEFKQPPTSIESLLLTLSSLTGALLVFANFFTCIVQDFEIIGDEVDELPLLRKLYLRGWFFYDLLGALPLDLIVSSFSTLAFRLLSALRLLRAIRIPFLFSPSSPLKTRPGWVRSLFGATGVLAALHLTACIWMLIDNQGGWDLGSLQAKTPMDRYLVGLYWAITTMTTVGYGDVTPLSQASMLVTGIVMVIGATGYAWIVGNISMLLTVNDEFERHAASQKQYLSSVLKHYSVPLPVQKEAFAVFPQIIEQTVLRGDESTLVQLPVGTKRRIFLAVKLSFLREVPLFKILSSRCLTTLAQRTVQKEYHEDEYVFQVADVGAEMYVVFRGVLEVHDPELGCAGSYGYKSHFGERSLMDKTMRKVALRCTTRAELFMLGGEEFRETMEMFPTDKTSFLIAAGYDVPSERGSVGSVKHMFSYATIAASFRRMGRKRSQRSPTSSPKSSPRSPRSPRGTGGRRNSRRASRRISTQHAFSIFARQNTVDGSVKGSEDAEGTGTDKPPNSGTIAAGGNTWFPEEEEGGDENDASSPADMRPLHPTSKGTKSDELDELDAYVRSQANVQSQQMVQSHGVALRHPIATPLQPLQSDTSPFLKNHPDEQRQKRGNSHDFPVFRSNSESMEFKQRNSYDQVGRRSSKVSLGESTCSVSTNNSVRWKIASGSTFSVDGPPASLRIRTARAARDGASSMKAVPGTPGINTPLSHSNTPLSHSQTPLSHYNRLTGGMPVARNFERAHTAVSRESGSGMSAQLDILTPGPPQDRSMMADVPELVPVFDDLQLSATVREAARDRTPRHLSKVSTVSKESGSPKRTPTNSPRYEVKRNFFEMPGAAPAPAPASAEPEVPRKQSLNTPASLAAVNRVTDAKAPRADTPNSFTGAQTVASGSMVGCMRADTCATVAMSPSERSSPKNPLKASPSPYRGPPEG
eukprot:Hpha_TRINITY_DN15627_c2_g3::TRINITY_DN15627_c2_g3_i1::g.98623::m.98623